jgi:hypothetical protein
MSVLSTKGASHDTGAIWLIGIGAQKGVRSGHDGMGALPVIRCPLSAEAENICSP